MAGKRGPNGRFAPADPSPPADALPQLVELTIETEQPEPIDPAGPAGWDDLDPRSDAMIAAAKGVSLPGDSDPALAVMLARALDEGIGLVFGAAYRAEPEQVDAVGQAADPVLRRALALVHADAVAETNIPAPLRELGTLVARAWVAWGDAFTVFVTEKIGELRRQREEVSDGTTAGSAAAGDRGVRGDGRAGGADEPGEARTPPISLADLIGPQIRASQAARDGSAPRLRRVAAPSARSDRR